MKRVDDAATLNVSWYKSSYSGAQSDCVEYGIVDEQTVAVCDSKSPHGPALLFPRSALTAFAAAAGSGEFGGLK